jgi:hypothetical protein
MPDAPADEAGVFYLREKFTTEDRSLPSIRLGGSGARTLKAKEFGFARLPVPEGTGSRSLQTQAHEWGHQGCPGQSLDMGSGADFTMAIRAYRDLLPCAARGDATQFQLMSAALHPNNGTHECDWRFDRFAHPKRFGSQVAIAGNAIMISSSTMLIAM